MKSNKLKIPFLIFLLLFHEAEIGHAKYQKCWIWTTFQNRLTEKWLAENQACDPS